MPNKTKLREILAILSPDGTEADFADFDKGVDKLKKGLKEKIQAKTLEDVNGQLRRAKEGFDLAPLIQAVKDIETNFDSRIQNVASALAEEVSKFDELSKAERGETSFKVAMSQGTVEALKEELATLKGQKDKEINDLREAIKNIPAPVDNTNQFSDVYARLDKMALDEASKPDVISPLKQEIASTRSDLITRINNHGGNMNRNIAIGGNTSVLSRYTDINLKAGANITLTYAYNDVTKYTDITLAATGGGGGGSVTGIIRSVNNIAVSTAAGATAGTDYVYLASGTLNVTLPTSIGNNNLYTVKNVGAGTITVLPTGAETIEGSPNITMPVQFTSVDLISNNSGNWNIT